MCGITGFWSGAQQSRFNEMEVLKSMADTLESRGPDGAGYWTNQEGLYLAHRRLAIIDLSAFGHQPMQSMSSRFHMTFNGEIYNYLQLKKELSALSPDYIWQGNSDTEVMLAAFEYWGIEHTLSRLNGMFACALWDARDKVLYLMRDRAGEKPLYYGWHQGYFLFASELSSLKAHPATHLQISQNAASLYMQYGYVPTPYSIYDGIFKLPPGCFVSLRLDQLQQGLSPKPIFYWSLQEVITEGMNNPYQRSAQQAIHELDAILQRAVQSQMVSDVPIGAFLSGGIDSSTVVALMQAHSALPVKTFTIGYESKEYNEAQHAAAIAKHLKTEHTEWYITEQDALSLIPELPKIYAEPFADSSQIPTTLVSQLARSKVTVSLSGDAGDELFGGYNRYIFAHTFMKKLNAVPLALRKLLALFLLKIPVTYLHALTQCIPGKNKPRLLAEKIHKIGHCIDYASINELYQSLVTAPLTKDLLQKNVLSASWHETNHLANPIEWMMAQDFMTYLLDDILVKVDRSAMSTSLESRVPFLDPEVISFAWRIPQHMKIHQGVSKWILREVLYRYVPRALIDRPKMGFGVPIDAWLRGPLQEWAAGLLDRKKLTQHGLLNVDLVQDLWQQHQSKRYNRQQQLWNILMFQAWIEHKESL